MQLIRDFEDALVNGQLEKKWAITGVDASIWNHLICDQFPSGIRLLDESSWQRAECQQMRDIQPLLLVISILSLPLPSYPLSILFKFLFSFLCSALVCSTLSSLYSKLCWTAKLHLLSSAQLCSALLQSWLCTYILSKLHCSACSCSAPATSLCQLITQTLLCSSLCFFNNVDIHALIGSGVA
jgi:hypothetical protein